MVTLGESYEPEYNFHLTEVRTEDIAAELKASNFLAGASETACKRHIRVANTKLRCHQALKFVYAESSNVFVVSSLDFITLATSSGSDMVLLLCAAMRWLKKPDRPKGDFPVYEFYKAGAKYISALRALISKTRRTKWSLFPSLGLNGIIFYDKTQSR